MREHASPATPRASGASPAQASANIQGFATDISVDQGQTVGFKVDTNASSYRLDIYRMGYYDGDGARRSPPCCRPCSTTSRTASTAVATGLVDCGNWTQNASWAVPADAVSGIYFANLVRTDATAGESHVFFVVRDDDGGSDLLFQTSDTTWQAYNAYGGNSLYTGSPAGRAYKVSYNRPFTTRGNAPEDWVFNAEYPMVRFLESNGYDVSYSTGVDTDRRGAELLEHEAFLSVGHDEYWSGAQRANVEAARAAGVHLAFFSGNEVFWKTRWENSIDGSGTPYRTLVTYKETHANAKIDPLARRVDRHLARPAVQPARRRRPAGERADRARSSRSTAARSTWSSGRPTARCASGATPGSPRSAANATTTDRHQRHRLRVGRGPRQRRSGRPVPSGSPRPAAPATGSRLRHAPTRRARPRTR